MKSGANKAARAQKESTAMSIAAQKQMFGEMKEILAPYVAYGLESMEDFKAALPGLLEGFDPTMAELEQTPGYQFAMEQGQKGVANAYSAKGLANSGAALKGAANFASGLAQGTFQNAQQYHTMKNAQNYNMLMGPLQMGANAAAMQGGHAMSLGANMGATYQNQGNQLSSIYMQDAAQKNQMMGTLFGGIMGFL